MAPPAQDIAVALMQQWVFLSDDPQVTNLMPKASFQEVADRNYQLKNKKVRRFLQWEDQIGMNIGWTDDASAATATKVQRWFFTREDTAKAGPITYGEPIALANGEKPSFIHYESQTIGVNLQWHDKPSYEWILLGGSRNQPVGVGESIAIYNQVDLECLIYVDRTMGGDVGWPSSSTWFDQIGDLFKGLTKAVIEKAIKDGLVELFKKLAK
jgi:hypothetical protein